MLRIWSVNSLRSVSSARFFCSSAATRARNSSEKISSLAHFKPRRGKQVDDFSGVDRAADDLPHRGVDVGRRARGGARSPLVRQPLANHRLHPLEERQVPCNGFRFGLVVDLLGLADSLATYTLENARSFSNAAFIAGTASSWTFFTASPRPPALLWRGGQLELLGTLVIDDHDSVRIECPSLDDGT